MYEILDYKFSTMSILALNRILTKKVALVTVAIKTSSKNTWLAYQAILPVNDIIQDGKNKIVKPKSLQAVARFGTKIPRDIALCMFPKLKKWRYGRTNKRHRCWKCNSHRNEMYLKKILDTWKCIAVCENSIEVLPVLELKFK